MIVRIAEKSPWVDIIDACSRVSLFFTNAIGTPGVVRFGDLTRTPDGGITWGDGRCELRIGPGGNFPGIWQLQSSGLVGTSCIGGFIPDIIAEANLNPNTYEHCLYLCWKLNLGDRDPDSENGHLIRCFCDAGMQGRGRGTALKFYAGGTFDCEYEVMIINGFITVMEAKFFKSADAPGMWRLYFKPKHSRLLTGNGFDLLPSRDFLISSELATVEAGNRESMLWVHNCNDGFARIDFSPLRSHRAAFLITEDAANPLRTRHSLEEALALKTAALRQGISISQSAAWLENGYSLRELRVQEYTCSPLPLSDDEFISKCKAFRLPIDPILRENPYEIRFPRDQAGTGPLVPYFFGKGDLTLLAEATRSVSIRKALLSLLSGAKRFPELPAKEIETLLFCRRGHCVRLKKSLSGIDNSKFRIYEDAALLASGKSAGEEMGILLDEIRPELVLLELSDYSAQQEKSLLEAVDLSLSRNVGVGVFCDIDNIPPALDEMIDRHLVIVSVHPGIYIIKEKKEDEVVSIQKFNFESEIISVSVADEIELAATIG